MADVEHEKREVNGALMFPLSGTNSYMAACNLLGSITIIWNDAHEQVFKLFWYFSGMSKEQAEAVFFSLRADSAQRDIAKAVIEKHPDYPNEHKEHALDWIRNLSKKSGERNAITHTMWDANSLLEGKMDPTPEISKEYLSRHLSDDNKQLFGALLNSLYEITLELNKATAIFEILNAETVEEVQRLGPEKFLRRFRGVPRYVKDFKTVDDEQRALKEKYLSQSLLSPDSTPEEDRQASQKANNNRPPPSRG
ncbi:MAG: hypothetical protein M0Z76_09200 [Gammaproteobacteria bacterium]|nr:hypothetical protein [Gammaproteobacteria bacterium]